MSDFRKYSSKKEKNIECNSMSKWGKKGDQNLQGLIKGHQVKDHLNSRICRLQVHSLKEDLQVSSLKVHHQVLLLQDRQLVLHLANLMVLHLVHFPN